MSVYASGARVKRRLQVPGRPVARLAAPETASRAQTGTVTRQRLARTILTATFPGDVSIRPTQTLLREALDQTQSIGWISQLRLEAGRRAGVLLRQIGTSPLGPLIVIRDETFFQGQPILLVSDPLTSRILWAPVLRRIYGNTQIEDLWMPLFCVSSNLTHAVAMVHRRGPLWQAVRQHDHPRHLLPHRGRQGPSSRWLRAQQPAHRHHAAAEP